jgi:lysozyme
MPAIKPNVIDMYHGDDNEAMPDFKALAAQGIFAIIHKATQGTNYIDPKCKDRLLAAQDAGLLIAAYHFGDSSSVADQAVHYMNTIELMPGDFGILDYEQNPASKQFTMGPSQAASFISLLTKAKIAPIIYGSDLITEMPAKIAASVVSMGAWLWHADYISVENKLPAPWTAAQRLFWQYTGSGSLPGISGKMDLNVYDGSQAQLTALWGQPCSTVSSKTT